MKLIRFWLQKHENGRYYRGWRDHRNAKRRRSLETPKKALATLLLDRFRREYEDDLRAGLDGPCPTFSDAKPLYIKHITARKSSGWVRSQIRYLDDLERDWGPLSLREILSFMILDVQTEYARRMKNNSVEKRMACIRSFFAWAVTRQFLLRSPALNVERLKDDTTVREEVISADEFESLLASAFLPKLRMFIVLAYHFGARPVELLRIAKSDFDPNVRQVRIRGAKQHQTTEKLRYLCYDEEVAAELAAYLRHLDPACEFLFEHDGAPGWPSLNATFQDAAKRAGLLASGRQITPMTLRHTFGVRKAKEGVPMREICYLMGHSSERTTEKWYARFVPDYVQR